MRRDWNLSRFDSGDGVLIQIMSANSRFKTYQIAYDVS